MSISFHDNNTLPSCARGPHNICQHTNIDSTNTLATAREHTVETFQTSNSPKSVAWTSLVNVSVAPGNVTVNESPFHALDVVWEKKKKWNKDAAHYTLRQQNNECWQPTPQAERFDSCQLPVCWNNMATNFAPVCSSLIGSTLAKKIETATQAKHRRVLAREITRLHHVCAVVSIFLARVVLPWQNYIEKTETLVKYRYTAWSCVHHVISCSITAIVTGQKSCSRFCREAKCKLQRVDDSMYQPNSISHDVTWCEHVSLLYLYSTDIVVVSIFFLAGVAEYAQVC